MGTLKRKNRESSTLPISAIKSQPAAIHQAQMATKRKSAKNRFATCTPGCRLMLSTLLNICLKMA
jgi:hypothetical protein